ncbi:IS200/IS605 family transposase [Hymenobacter terricola]|uniref:IS200/IS605 family transposase n=1 Tax=Hymenobacter terricola TaxID=2819236 RepID=UPI001B3177E7|nr:IS200/IS605 family transposase [Hymenobacter terricola]
MAGTYTQLHIQIVFAVSGRTNLIPAKHQEQLNQYVTGTITNKGQKVLAINGMPDHLHILIGLRPEKALADVVRDIKANASRFINEQNWVVGKFAWQRGYGAFSYSASHLDQVIRYIQHQQLHHATRTFREEYQALLDRFGIQYDPRFLVDEVD